MPTLSMFYGIVIRMYFDDHYPPHFHALYQGKEAKFDFDGNVLEGSIPSKQRKFVEAWAELHRDELEANWALAQEREDLYKIDPLR